MKARHKPDGLFVFLIDDRNAYYQFYILVLGIFVYF